MGWAHLDPMDILHMHGIEPHPGPADLHINQPTNNAHHNWKIIDGRWTHNLSTDDDQDLHVYANIISRNIRGLFANLSAAIRGRHQVVALQEADIAEHSVPDLIAQAEAAGYKLDVGNICPLGCDASKSMGRRVALLT